MVLPLATFANDRINNAISECVIYVEWLDENQADSNQVVVGQMFFQSIAVMQEMEQNVAHNLTMAVNINALNGTYIGNQTVDSCDPAAFQIVPVTLKPYKYPSTNNVSIPVFELTSVTGISPSSFAIYFMMDLNSDNTVVWDQSCVYEPTGLSCKYQPVAVQTLFNSTASYQQSYIDYETSGYLVSGNVSLSTICNDDNCKIIDIYSATTISEDNWL